MIGELYPGEFEAMEHNGRMDALEQEPCGVFDEYGNYKYPSDVELTEPNTATSMPCEDEYIKVPKKALKYRTAGMVAYNAEWLKNHFDTERAVICGAQEPCEDAISRQAVLDALTKTSGIRGDALKALYDLPPVNPQDPKTGHWIFDEILDKHYYCSECKSMGVDYWDFCPYCGCAMKGE